MFKQISLCMSFFYEMQGANCDALFMLCSLPLKLNYSFINYPVPVPDAIYFKD